MIDPLAEVVTLLQPSLLFSKTLAGAGSWRIAPPDTGHPIYSVVLEGECGLSVAGHESIHVVAGDFVLVPAHRFEVSSREPPAERDNSQLVALGDGEFRVGAQSGATDLRMLIGHCNGLAKQATLSRSAFFERFKQTVGVPPMAYLLAWRMALAKQMLRQNENRIAEVAERVGYHSASAFSVAFTRSVGRSPAQYARASHRFDTREGPNV